VFTTQFLHRSQYWLDFPIYSTTIMSLHNDFFKHSTNKSLIVMLKRTTTEEYNISLTMHLAMTSLVPVQLRYASYIFSLVCMLQGMWDDAAD